MPRDSAGSYSLPVGYLAVTGEPILASQHNPPLEDLAAAMSGSLPRSGAAPMTAALKGYSGTAAAPGYTFSAATTTGIYLRSDGGLGLSSSGTAVGAVPIGAGMDFWGPTAPAGWIFAYGQELSRTSYAALYAAIGTSHGPGDGSTTFNAPDKRDRASFGKGDMGGTAASRITNQSGGWEGDTLGAAGGSETHALTEAQLPATTKSATRTQDVVVSFEYSTAQQYVAGSAPGIVSIQSSGGTLTQIPVGTLVTQPSFSVSFGSGNAHNNLPPGIVCNYIIFTGVF